MLGSRYLAECDFNREDMADKRGASDGGVRVHRGVLQQTTAAFKPGLHDAGGVREAVETAAVGGQRLRSQCPLIWIKVNALPPPAKGGDGE